MLETNKFSGGNVGQRP
jgi:chromosome segregation ATPase